ncbi:hypothetical protein KQ693_10340 [Thermus sp. PS18]|uniref:hypothetical protein n=1 Tax=Thermus sp. PS18 TaxID=2849039 RepID=UPI002263DC2C|nr:hypothetical protein [Thermus sp. PS18]UZX15014.1 hypothetical protein KQ693_10340 [Thermus sp. PS18]
MEPREALAVVTQHAFEAASGADYLRLERAEAALRQALGRLEGLEREAEALRAREAALLKRIALLEGAQARALALLYDLERALKGGAR